MRNLTGFMWSTNILMRVFERRQAEACNDNG
jgi:hypothetical protein